MKNVVYIWSILTIIKHGAKAVMKLPSFFSHSWQGVFTPVVNHLKTIFKYLLPSILPVIFISYKFWNAN